MHIISSTCFLFPVISVKCDRRNTMRFKLLVLGPAWLSREVCTLCTIFVDHGRFAYVWRIKRGTGGKRASLFRFPCPDARSSRCKHTVHTWSNSRSRCSLLILVFGLLLVYGYCSIGPAYMARPACTYRPPPLPLILPVCRYFMQCLTVIWHTGPADSPSKRFYYPWPCKETIIHLTVTLGSGGINVWIGILWVETQSAYTEIQNRHSSI